MNEETIEQIEASPSPFKHIALSLSGGGIRAVGYHLGTLDYLHHVDLLKEVHTLSSVSGGSLIATGYALSQKKGESFQDFYDNLCEFIPKINTFEELLKVLKRPEAPVASGSKTLITALAAVYRDAYFEKYYGDPSFGIFWNAEPEIHLKEIIFNATEFKTGIGFRFQSGQYSSLTGNGKVSIPEEFAKDVRLSDIMAASSCIPGGMEPLQFPQDFHWPDDPAVAPHSTSNLKRPRCEKVAEYLQSNYGVNTLSLMDGGVYDNQGITSIILTEARRFHARRQLEVNEHDVQAYSEPTRARSWARWLLSSMEMASSTERQKDMGEVDLFIVSDTPIISDPMYSAPESEHAKGLTGFIFNLKLKTVYNFMWAVTLVLLLSVVVGFSFIREILEFTSVESGNIQPWQTHLVNGVYLFGMLVQIGVVLGTVTALSFGKKVIHDAAKKVTNRMPPMSSDIWIYAKNLSLGQIWKMLDLRASSMSALTAKIFMHRVRQMGYSLLYSHENFENRVMDNNINDTLHAETNNSIPDFLRDPSDDAEEVVKKAATMPTKLWVDKPAQQGDRDDLDVLIAAGHISTCFNIIEYIWGYHRDAEGEVLPNVLPLFEQASRDWFALNEDPYCLLKLRESVGRERGVLFWDEPH